TAREPQQGIAPSGGRPRNPVRPDGCGTETARGVPGRPAEIDSGPRRETRSDEAAGRLRSGGGEGDARGPRPPRGETQGGGGTGPEGRCRPRTPEEAARTHQRRSQEDSVRVGR